MSLSSQIKSELVKAIASIGDLAITGKIKRVTEGYDTILGEVTKTYKTANFKGAWDTASTSNFDSNLANANANSTTDRDLIIINDDVVFEPKVTDELVFGGKSYVINSVTAEAANVAWTVTVQVL